MKQLSILKHSRLTLKGARPYRVNGTFPFLTQINLPDGKTWSFSYYHQPSPGMPSTLLLAQVNYPMGGYSRYNYGNNNQMSAGLTQRIVNANNGQGEITTNYIRTGCATTCYVTSRSQQDISILGRYL